MTGNPFPKARSLIALGALLGLAGQAGAHTQSTSYSSWRIDGPDVRVTYSVPLVEAARLSRDGASQPSDERLLEYLTERLAVSAGGKPCALAGTPEAQAATPQFRRIEIRYQCPSAANIALHSDALVDLLPSHV